MLDLMLILKNYDLPAPLTIMPMADSGLNNTLWRVQAGDQAYVLKQHTSTSYENRASIAYEFRVLRHVSENHFSSFAVPVPLLTREGNELCETEDGLFSLMPFLPGTRVNPVELRDVEAFGRALGRLQTAVAAYPVESRPGRPLFEQMFAFPAPIDVCALTPQHLSLPDEPGLRDLLAWWRDEAQALKAFVETEYRALPQQMCHNDFTPNNVLVEIRNVQFGTREVRAVLDFEFACPAARALDVAMAIRMIMRIWENPDPWTPLWHFIGAYRRAIDPPLTKEEIAALPLLLRLRGSMSILWWVGRQQNLARVPFLIENQRRMVDWLSQHEGQFLEFMARWYS